MVDFLMPESDKDRGENPIVDSLAVASDWTIVSKCALHGLIYVFDLKVNIRIDLMFNIEILKTSKIRFYKLNNHFTSIRLLSKKLNSKKKKPLVKKKALHV